MINSATKQSSLPSQFWIASRSLSSGARSRDSLAHNDGVSPPDDDADHIWRREVFVLDRGAGGGAVFRCQQLALFGEDHPAKTPPVRQHAVVVDQVVTLRARKNPRLRFVQRI